MECQYKLQILQFNFKKFATYYITKESKTAIFPYYKGIDEETGEIILDLEHLQDYIKWINGDKYDILFKQAWDIYSERIYEKKLLFDENRIPICYKQGPNKGKQKFKINSHFKIKRIKWKRDGNLENFYEWADIPCGTCEMCRENHANEWATKSWMEMQYHEQSCFLTLTYDNEHLPHINNNKNKKATLEEYKEVWPKFIRAIRDHYRDKGIDNIKFLMCGEYGPRTKRPHYHAIIFGLWPDDAKPDKHLSKSKHPMWTSEYLTKTWGKGIVKVGLATVESAAYVAQYTAKKLSKKETEGKGRVEEYIRASNRPGLGTPFFIENKEKILANSAILYNGFTHPIPRTFLRKWERENPLEYWEWNNRRLQKIQLNQEFKEDNGLTQEENYNNNIKKFKEKALLRIRNDL